MQVDFVETTGIVGSFQRSLYAPDRNIVEVEAIAISNLQAINAKIFSGDLFDLALLLFVHVCIMRELDALVNYCPKTVRSALFMLSIFFITRNRVSASPYNMDSPSARNSEVQSTPGTEPGLV